MTMQPDTRAVATAQHKKTHGGKPRDASTAAGRSRRTLRRLPVPIVLYGVLAVLILLPVALVVLSAVTSTTPRPGNISLDGLTLSNFGSVFADAGARTATLNSLVVGVGASILALAIGGFLAFISARTNVHMRRFLYLVGLIPMFLPSYVGALAWAILGAPNAGLLNVILRDIGIPGFVDVYNIVGLIFVLGIYYAPYAFLLIHSSFSLMNPDLEEAASVHGAPVSRVLRRVTFPLATPAILGSAILIFTLTIENFPVSQIIGAAGGLDTLPTFIWRLMNSTPSRGNEAAAVAIALVITVLIATLVQRRILAKRNFTTVSGKGVKPRRINLGRGRVPALIVGLVYFVLSAVLPLLALLVVALHDSPYISTFTNAFEPGVWTIDAFADAVSSATVQKATVNSVVVGIGTAIAGTLLAFIVAYVVNRTKLPGRSGLEYISMLPLAVPAIVLGLGLMWTWLLLPIPIYGTLVIMIVAFTAAQMPQGFRGIAGSILQVDKDLEDSAVMHGASRARAVTRITLPLMRVGITSTFLLLLMLAMRELTVPLFLFTTNTRLLSIVIFDNFENGVLQSSAAISLLYCVVIFALAALAQRYGAKEGASGSPSIAKQTKKKRGTA
ncbi:iron(III) transport system permease protein [Homoserinimonas aerilata]|uniref:Iron(III) transport system permease protein n=1 Tax=Homoserinimonas aerilata TaxID=1162970 RepID=A0A542YAD0_9MICO|nr:iron ABC transporter permease [Homoserinimonas aerilata]TQL45037.1 iron(III) transport system permease protein [Homoserinimonas aerilata]